MDRLKSLRLLNGLTQKEVSAVLNMDQSNYSKMEKNKRYLSYKRCKKLALFYGVSMDYLCSLTDNPKPYEKSEYNGKPERIKTLRVEKGLTQIKLQHLTGIEQSDLSKIENGRCKMTLPQCIRPAKALDTSMDHLAGLTDIKKRYK